VFTFFKEGLGAFKLSERGLIGTALMASGTAALNQWYEADSDARMRRTRNRPIPGGRIRRIIGLLFGLGLSLTGLADLWMETNKLAVLIGLFTLVTYICLYTPLKAALTSLHHDRRGRDFP